MQYYGNLALRPEQKTKDPEKRRSSQPSPSPRRRSIPVGEKLLYLLTVFVFVAVASLIIYRYAGLYQLNRDIQTTQSDYEKLVDDSKELQRQIDQLKDPAVIREKALSYGLQPLNQTPITLSPSGSSSGTSQQP
ncbi:cell division protein FtsL [Cohnella zeiphila]|nr:septum formation initiator family protein [Cohnella zeiphila]